MKGLAILLGGVAGVSLILGLIYKAAALAGNILGPAGLGPLSFQRLANTCLIFSIGLGVLQLLKAKEILQRAVRRSDCQTERDQ